MPFGNIFQQAVDYWVDAGQRTVLYLETLRERGNIHNQHVEQAMPNVLHYNYEIVIDGRDLLEPVNYLLLRINAPEGVKTDPTKRPFMIFDPRAGHGPGIGGMKKESEIGLALRAGHPCYFVCFFPEPIPGQCIEDISRAAAIFVSKVVEMHPLADRPCLIGNCQAGWQLALMSAIEPDLPGVLILAGAPLSYWAGVHGKAPMRYTGGILGGSWLTTFTSDMGNGKFDGAWLIINFENMNPSNTIWKKDYNVYSKIDTEAPRFLEFERWWGSPVLLNREEIQFIVDELFIGNHLSAAKINTSGGVRIDLRSIKTPIVVFCSHGDDITPPPQALDWILDLYSCEDEIVAYGQTIIYSVHENIGHLGIFVSGSVAQKEHEKFIHNIDLIETLPPGLYEAIITEKEADTANSDLASGKYVMRFERRTFDDIRAIGCNDEDDDRRFATVARLSENVQGLYNTFVAPIVRAAVTEDTAVMLRKLHPTRVRFEMYSDKNPWMAPIPTMAEWVKANRKPVSPDNLFWVMQERISHQIVSFWDVYRDVRDSSIESFFMAFFGSPLLQASVGLRTLRPYMKEGAARDVQREKEITKRLQELQTHFAEGGLAEALVRSLIYISKGSRGLDEREFAILRRLRNESRSLPAMTQVEYKDMVRSQYMILLLDEDRALQAIPLLLENANRGQDEALAIIDSVVTSIGVLGEEETKRLDRIKKLFAMARNYPRRRASDFSSPTKAAS